MHSSSLCLYSLRAILWLNTGLWEIQNQSKSRLHPSGRRQTPDEVAYIRFASARMSDLIFIRVHTTACEALSYGLVARRFTDSEKHKKCC
ncbi:uncharacterized protein LAJ45_06047 [Morchella importuna]|uniref:uncharacterized protein n=1 Tax=Morchella importuna TaxID=1174673 RepID=UPI001E8D0B80|nr:uncharacterized protein LAJ45_06047 [Morchella importuna]KAH8149895.1 hypothetical protein LAJ45_06047 [Morchella importuna]